MKTEITKKQLIQCAHKAGANAIKKTRAAGGAITFQAGKKIIKEYSDGTQEVLAILDRAYVKPHKKRYKLS